MPVTPFSFLSSWIPLFTFFYFKSQIKVLSMTAPEEARLTIDRTPTLCECLTFIILKKPLKGRLSPSPPRGLPPFGRGAGSGGQRLVWRLIDLRVIAALVPPCTAHPCTSRPIVRYLKLPAHLPWRMFTATAFR
jgi:hypothetical protein